MAEQTAEERIEKIWANLSDSKLDDDIVDMMVMSAGRNSVVNEHVEDIVESRLFPAYCTEIIKAMSLAESLGVNETSTIRSVLGFCDDPNLLNNAVEAACRIPNDDLRFILGSESVNMDFLGYTRSEAGQVTADWLTCRANDMSSSIILDDCFTLIGDEDDDDFISPMSLGQIHAAAEISQQISDMADKKAAEVCKSDADLDNVSYSMKWEMFSALREQDCFDGSMSPSQMKALSDSLCRLVEPMVGWDGVNLDVGNNLYAVRDSIMNDREPKAEGVWNKVRKNKEAVAEYSTAGKSDVREHSADKNQSKDILE